MMPLFGGDLRDAQKYNRGAFATSSDRPATLENIVAHHRVKTPKSLVVNYATLLNQETEKASALAKWISDIYGFGYGDVYLEIEKQNKEAQNSVAKFKSNTVQTITPDYIK